MGAHPESAFFALAGKGGRYSRNGEELCRRIQEENISSVALLFVIRSAFEETSDVLAPLADLFLDHQMLVYAYELLKELQKQMPDVADIKGTDNRIRDIYRGEYGRA